MDPGEYVDARWSALVRAAVLMGASEAEAPAVVRQVLAGNQRRIRRATDPDPLVHRALEAAIPGAARTAFAAEADPVARQDMLIDAAQAEAGTEVRAGAPVGPTPPPSPPRRRTRVLVGVGVATALLVLAGISYGVTRDHPTPLRKDGDVLRADQVPSFFGYAADADRTMLAKRGLDVTVEPFRSCEVLGRVVATDPATGTTYHQGDPITVYSAVPSGAECFTDYDDVATAWRILDFANGRGPAPHFAKRVIVYVGDGERDVVTRADIPSQWESTGVLAQLRQASDRVALDPDDQDYALPTLQVSVATAAGCGAPDPPVVDPAQTLSFTIGAPAGRTSCPLRLDVFRDRGRIEAVALYPSLS